jgi:hypothetical protein
MPHGPSVGHHGPSHNPGRSPTASRSALSSLGPVLPAHRAVSGMMHENDGRFLDGSAVLVRYPLDGPRSAGDRETWPWLPGTVEQQCDPIE